MHTFPARRSRNGWRPTRNSRHAPCLSCCAAPHGRQTPARARGQRISICASCGGASSHVLERSVLHRLLCGFTRRRCAAHIQAHARAYEHTCILACIRLCGEAQARLDYQEFSTCALSPRLRTMAHRQVRAPATSLRLHSRPLADLYSQADPCLGPPRTNLMMMRRRCEECRLINTWSRTPRCRRDCDRCDHPVGGRRRPFCFCEVDGFVFCASPSSPSLSSAECRGDAELAHSRRAATTWTRPFMAPLRACGVP